MWKSSVALWGLVGALAGCAGMNAVQTDVSTFSQWTPDRKPTTYAFERLPSQQADAQSQDRIEAAARPALAAAGFAETAAGQAADVTVQVGLRISRTDRSLYDDPFWWRGGMYYSRFGRGAFWGPSMSFHFESPRYDREVAVLIRDRQSNQPLYEARAASDGLTEGDPALIGAMFTAAMKDFPHTGINPRRVTVPLPGSAGSPGG